MVQAGKSLLFEQAELPSLLPLDEAVQSFRDMHLDVEGLVLLEKSSEKSQVILYLFDFAQKLL
jgi:hypothetical protein